MYISKIGADSHRAEGVQPVDEKEELRLRKVYQNGSLCGNVSDNLIVQHYIHNPLLLYGHKFDFRMYMVIASTNPVIAYYHDGFLRVSLHEYDVNSQDKGKKAMIHLIRLTQEPFLVRSSIYELFGVDFMLDENLNLWFIESNSAPMLVGGSEEKERFVTKMLKDQSEIITGLLRSRMKRVISYVNSLLEEDEVLRMSSEDIYIPSLGTRGLNLLN